MFIIIINIYKYINNVEIIIIGEIKKKKENDKFLKKNNNYTYTNKI